MTDIKRMSVKEFRELGYLQELNRRFLHPLGLALEVVIGEENSEQFGGVWDSRDDPEGLIYAPGMINAKTAKRIDGEFERRANPRMAALGYVRQPADE